MSIRVRNITKMLLSLLLAGLLTLSIMDSAIVYATGPVNFYAEDTITGGNWTNAIGSPVHTYGSYARILPNPNGQDQQAIGGFSVPVGYSTNHTKLEDPPFNWTAGQVLGLQWYQPNSPYRDEYVNATPPGSPPVLYFINGTTFATGGNPPIVQYPTFEWNWSGWDATQADHREVYYNNASGTCGVGYRYACWDDGGERSQPVNGYFNVTMTFPNGTWLLSLYGYNSVGLDAAQRVSETYNIYDATGTTLLASKSVSGSAWNGGVYEIFSVIAPLSGLTIIVQVYNNPGHPTPTLNVLLSGIFVDRLPPPPPTGGFLFSISPFSLLAPWIGLALILAVPAALIAYTKNRTKKKA
jgi:hypothetical protein